jgi:N-acetylneuraminic acid mutarotase
VITIGGSYWAAKVGGVAEKTWIPDVYWLGRTTDSWERLADFPSAIGQALAVTVGGKIVVVGGRNAERAFVETYWRVVGDHASRWERGPDLPRPLFALTGGAFESTVYAVTDPYATIEQPSEHPEPSTVLAWDVSATHGAWRHVADVPDSEVGFRTTAIADGRIFLFGGATQPKPDDLRLSDTLWILDLKAGAWTRGAKLPYPLRDSTAACVDNRFILLIGGVEDALSQQQSPDGQARIILTNRCLVYDITSDRFTAAEPLRLATADHGVAIRGSEVMAIAGEDSPYRTRTDLVQRSSFSPLAICAATAE